MAAGGGRSAEILERLAREQPRRSLFRRPPSPFDADIDTDTESDPPVAGDPLRPARQGSSPSWPTVSWPPGRMLGVLAAIACGGVVAALLLFDRRPPAIEERLPLASEESSATTAPGAAAANDGSAPNDVAAAAEPVEGDPDDAGGAVFVHVAGAVSSPGVVELPSGSRVVDAVRAAGGLRPDADPDRVNLAAELVDGQRIVIPAVGQEVPPEVVPTGPSPAAGGATSSGGVPGAGGATGPVDLNTATAEQLDSLPGVGPATAQAILSHREQHGPFRSVEDLIEVRGIGEAKLDGLRDLVTVGGS